MSNDYAPVQPEYGRMPRVQSECGNIARSTVYAWMEKSNFPAPLRLSARTVVWDMAAVRDWIKSHASVEGEV